MLPLTRGGRPVVAEDGDDDSVTDGLDVANDNESDDEDDNIVVMALAEDGAGAML
jgi:hypothetical protein